MYTTDTIIRIVERLEQKYGTRDPYLLCDRMGIKIRKIDLGKKLKGFFFYQSRIQNIVVDTNLNEVLERILIAHELGHAILHKEVALMGGFQEMEFFDSISASENEANLFSAELLLTDEEVLGQLEGRSFFEAAQALYVPAALLDYKFRAMCEKGLLSQTMEYRNSRYLKEDLGAYDSSYGSFE